MSQITLIRKMSSLEDLPIDQNDMSDLPERCKTLFRNTLYEIQVMHPQTLLQLFIPLGPQTELDIILP